MPTILSLKGRQDFTPKKRTQRFNRIVTYNDIVTINASIRAGDIDMVIDLVDSMDWSDDSNRLILAPSPLQVAASRGDLTMVRLLLDRGVDYCHHRLWAPPVVAAARNSHLHVVTALVSEYGYDANEIDVRNPSGETVFFEVVTAGGSVDMLKRLYALGSDPDAQDTEGQRPIDKAVENFRTLHYLAISLNVPLDTPKDNRPSLLCKALQDGNSKSALILLKAGHPIGPKESSTLCSYSPVDLPFNPSDEILNYIKEVFPHPRSLAETCCFTIRRTLGKTLPHCVDSLPLPEKVIEFIKLTHIVREEDDEQVVVRDMYLY